MGELAGRQAGLDLGESGLGRVELSLKVRDTGAGVREVLSGGDDVGSEARHVVDLAARLPEDQFEPMDAMVPSNSMRTFWPLMALKVSASEPPESPRVGRSPASAK